MFNMYWASGLKTSPHLISYSPHQNPVRYFHSHYRERKQNLEMLIACQIAKQQHHHVSTESRSLPGQGINLFQHITSKMNQQQAENWMNTKTKCEMPRVIRFGKSNWKKNNQKENPFGIYGFHNGCASFLTAKGGEKRFSPDILKTENPKVGYRLLQWCKRCDREKTLINNLQTRMLHWSDWVMKMYLQTHKDHS